MKCRKCHKEIPNDSFFCLHCGWNQKKAPREQKRKQRGNGQGSVYKLPSGSWRAAVTYGFITESGKLKQVKRTKSGFATKKEAIDYIGTLKNISPVTKKSRITTLSSLWEWYSEGPMKKLSKNKQTHYKTAYSRMKDIACIDISQLVIEDIQGVIELNAPTYYPAKDMRDLLSHLYKRAIATQKATTNLSLSIDLPDLHEKETTAFTKEEIESLWKNYGEGNKTTGFILLMIYTGMMPGELIKAQKSMINWEQQYILGCGLKTEKRKKTPIVIADIIIPVLRDLCELSSDDKLLPLPRDKFYQEFDDILRRCGCRDLTPYACRHTTATALALGNIAPSMVQEIMRHTKFSTTQHYIHIGPAPMLEAVNNAIKMQK